MWVACISAWVGWERQRWNVPPTKHGGECGVPNFDYGLAWMGWKKGESPFFCYT